MLPLFWIDRACVTAPACQILAMTDDIWASYGDLSEFRMVAAAILFSDSILPVLRYFNRACSGIPPGQISSRSSDICPSYNGLNEFKMAAAAILDFLLYFSFCVGSIRLALLHLPVKFH